MKSSSYALMTEGQQNYHFLLKRKNAMYVKCFFLNILLINLTIDHNYFYNWEISDIKLRLINN